MIEAYAQAELYTKDAPSIALMREAGRARAVLRFDLVNPQQWRPSPSGVFHEGRGVADVLIGVCPATPEVEFMAVLSRGFEDPPFTAAERDPLGHAMNHLGRFARRVALSFGAPGSWLSPWERETLAWLFQGHSEKYIAQEMELAKSTVHEYVLGVYRKLGVTSRPELMARWLNI